VTASKSKWLQRELQSRLMFPVLGIVLLSTLLCGYGAQFIVNRVFDGRLMDAAESVAQQVKAEHGLAHLELTPQARAMLLYDAVDTTSFEVIQGRRVVAGMSGIAESGSNNWTYGDHARVYDGSYLGQPVRIVNITLTSPEAADTHVLLAETLIKRHRARRGLILITVPVGLLVLAAAFAIGQTVRRTIQPIERMAARWNESSATSLNAIPVNDVPRELLPFAAALNKLLERVRYLLERERQFASTAAHQLRTPLAGLQLGLARAAQAQDVESMRGVLAELGATTQRTSRLIQQILALSRLDPEVRGSMETGRVDLVQLTQELGESYADMAFAKQISLELELGHGTRREQLTVRGHHDLLTEALGNILDNAIRYTPERGRVLVSLEVPGPTVRILDSGPGLDQGEEERVFERFVRGRRGGGDGSGLGLAIAREIATLHGASLVAEPSAMGGACFVLRFSES